MVWSETRLSARVISPISCVPLQFGDELDRGALAKAAALDGAPGGVDPDRGFREDDFDGFRATANLRPSVLKIAPPNASPTF